MVLVSIHGPPTCEKIGEQKFRLVKYGPQNCPASGYGNFVPQFFHMFGDSVYAYHDNATRKNHDSCPLPGSWSTKSLEYNMMWCNVQKSSLLTWANNPWHCDLFWRPFSKIFSCWQPWSQVIKVLLKYRTVTVFFSSLLLANLQLILLHPQGYCYYIAVRLQYFVSSAVNLLLVSYKRGYFMPQLSTNWIMDLKVGGENKKRGGIYYSYYLGGCNVKGEITFYHGRFVLLFPGVFFSTPCCE